MVYQLMKAAVLGVRRGSDGIYRMFIWFMLIGGGAYGSYVTGGSADGNG